MDNIPGDSYDAQEAFFFRRKKMYDIGGTLHPHPDPEKPRSFHLQTNHTNLQNLMIQRWTSTNDRKADYVNTIQQLTSVKENLRNHKVLAISLTKLQDTFYIDKPSILSISTVHQDFIIDLLYVGHKLKEIIGDELEQALLIVFDFDDDVQIVKQDLNIMPTGVFDAQRFYKRHINEQCTTAKFSTVMMAILPRFFQDVRDNKFKAFKCNEDWNGRPLTAEHVMKARCKPYLLITAWRILCGLYSKHDLQLKGCDPLKLLLVAPITMRDSPTTAKEYYLVYRASENPDFVCNAQIQQKIQVLWNFRRQVAIYRDLPPAKIMSFGLLVKLATNPPTTKDILASTLEDDGGEEALGTILKYHLHDLFKVIELGETEFRRQCARPCRRCQHRGHLMRYCFLDESCCLWPCARTR